jgi:transcriptional regulator with XRE-family HTH domain
MSVISDNIRDLRIIRGYSLRELAAKLNCAPNSLSDWEKGLVSPPVDTAMELCKIFNVSANELFGWEPCQELEEFREENKTLLEEIESLQKEKVHVEAKLREYMEKLSQRT